MKNSKTVLYYDDTCSFCSSSILFLKRINANVSFKGLSKAKLPEYLSAIDSLILLKEKNYFYYSDAILEALKLSNVSLLGYIGYIIPKNIRDYIYKKIAKKRHCLISKEKQL